MTRPKKTELGTETCGGGLEQRPTCRGVRVERADRARAREREERLMAAMVRRAWEGREGEGVP